MFHFNIIWKKEHSLFISLSHSGMSHPLYFLSLSLFQLHAPSFILLVFRLPCPKTVPFSIKFCYKINTTQDVVLPSWGHSSVSSKLKLFKTKEYTFREKKCDSLKQKQREIFWSERLFQILSHIKKAAPLSQQDLRNSALVQEIHEEDPCASRKRGSP